MAFPTQPSWTPRAAISGPGQQRTMSDAAGLRRAAGSYAEGVAKLDAEVWFRFDSENVSPVADIQRLKDAAERAGFELRGAKVTPAPPGESKAGWSEKRADGWTSYVPLDSEPNQ